MFFFEKKNQKTFATVSRSLTQAPAPDSAPQLQKFFGSFFQKRTPSFLAIYPCPSAAGALATTTMAGRNRRPFSVQARLQACRMVPGGASLGCSAMA